MSSGVEHFDSSLPSYFTSVTASGGTVTISDSNLVCDIPTTNDAAFVYYNTKLNLTVPQMHTFCYRTSNLSLQNGVYLINRATAPIADTFNNFDGQGVTRAGFSSTGGFFLSYWDTGGTRRAWDNATQAWSTTTTLQAIDTLEIEDYITLTLEIDPNLGNPRFRWAARGRTGTTFAAMQAERMSVLTDWISFVNARTNTDLWLTFGWPYTDQTILGTHSCEYYRYAIDTGVKDYIWTNARDDSAIWNIRASYSLDYEFYLPVDRTTKTIDVGAGGTWDDSQISFPWVVKDGASYYLFYAGDGGSGYEIGLATGAAPDAVLTKDAGNPILPRAAGTDRDQVFRPTVWKDLAETDASKTWKMLFTGFSSIDSKWRVYYATAPAANGTWTVNTTAVLGPGATNDPDERGCSIGFVQWDASAGHYKVWYAAQAGSSGLKWTICLATSNGSDITTLTKDAANNPYIPRAADAKQVITSQSTRTSNMTDTTGFEKDQPVIIDQDATSSQWITSRVRKVTTNTSVELYNKPAGITGNTAEMAGWNYGAIDVRGIRQVGNNWYFYVIPFAMHATVNGDNFDAYCETSGLLYSTGLLDKPKTWKWLSTPFVPLSQTIAQMARSASNENAVFVTVPLGLDLIRGRARRGIGRHK